MSGLDQRTKVIGRMFENWSPKLWQELKPANSNGRVGTRLLSECDLARIWEVRLKPGQRLSFHRHVLNYFWTVLNGGIAHSRTADGSTQEIEYYRGDTKNLRYHRGEGLTHDLENVGTTELLFITVEFLDSENSPPPLPLAKVDIA
jgi:mannose-6-phosphate isomerase-like protein (cupin superfamily)